MIIALGYNDMKRQYDLKAEVNGAMDSLIFLANEGGMQCDRNLMLHRLAGGR